MKIIGAIAAVIIILAVIVCVAIFILLIITPDWLRWLFIDWGEKRLKKLEEEEAAHRKAQTYDKQELLPNFPPQIPDNEPQPDYRQMQAYDKGMWGESAVAAELAYLPPAYYTIFNNVILKTSSGATTQIDHVVISIYGIFVIETKNFSGRIYGRENSEMWHEYFPKDKNNEDFPFRNPIKQNFAHKKAVAETLAVDESCIFSIIAFSQDANTQKVTASLPIVKFDEVARHLRSYDKQIFSHEQKEYLAQKLLAQNIESAQVREAHVSRLRDKIKTQEQDIKSGRCPRCGGELILREGKYGSFYGCSRYPKCRYTLSQKSEVGS